MFLVSAIEQIVAGGNLGTGSPTFGDLNRGLISPATPGGSSA